MSRYLLKVEEVYRCDSESESQTLINEAKQDGNVVKFSSVHKERKVKGEVEDEWWRTSITRAIDDEKEPSGYTTIEYNTNSGPF